ncbi:hypothetical protein OEZ86_010648 [Tetradesmus obliquus]|nr:hypothetical protein OEZ86_010648 [Tetradesmus obliquus]
MAPPQQMRVVSQPLAEVVGHGANAKHVKDCTELYLGGKGIEQLAGFERLTNLEVLWLNDNKLTAITGLNSNMRIKQLYAHNNAICTLKGSLLRLKFLTDLDLSHNQLRDLRKLLQGLARLRFLQQLNLQGNRCCEEPDYRLLLIHVMPSLMVLDHHQVTPAERLQAAAQIGNETGILNVAFGTGVPQSVLQHRTAAAGQCQDRSVLEQELTQRAEAIRQKQQQAAADAEAALFAQNPDADYWAPRSSLPPPAGLAKAQQAWAAAAAGTACNGTGQALHTQHIAASLMAPAGVQARDSQAQVLQLQLTGSTASTSVLLGTGNSAGSKWTANMSAGSLAAASAVQAAAASYSPKDVLVLHSYSKCSSADDACGGSSTACSKSSKGIAAGARYLDGTFAHHLTQRSWEAEPKALKL